MTVRADQRGWGNPFDPGFDDQMTTVAAGGICVRVHPDTAGVFRYLLTLLAKHYNLAGFADDWGYARRPIRGREDEWAATHDLRYLSNHSWGLAVDLDATVNPMTTDLAAKHEFIRTVVDPIIEAFGGRLLWGGEYASARKDYMHFEYVGTSAQAQADSTLARHLLEDHTRTQAPTEGEPDMVIIYATGKATALLAAGKLTPLSSNAEKDALAAAGVPVKGITPTQYGLIERVAAR